MTSPDVVVAGLLEAQDNLTPKLNWQLRPATVVVAGVDALVGKFDGEGFEGTTSSDVPMISLVGYVSAGTRVMVMIVPPAGNYVIARVFGTDVSEWTDYFPTFLGAVSNPDVGLGDVAGRWKMDGWRTITVEVFISFGGGASQGSGRYTISTPFLIASRSIQAATGACYMFDSGTANRAGIVNVTATGDSYFITNTPNGDVGSGVPQAWAVGDSISFSITHEVASFDPL